MDLSKKIKRKAQQRNDGRRDRLLYVMGEFENDNVGQFAGKIGVSAGTVSKWRAGRQAISNRSMMAICRAYPQVDYDWLSAGKRKAPMSLKTRECDMMAKMDAMIQQMDKLNKLISALEKSLKK